MRRKKVESGSGKATTAWWRVGDSNPTAVGGGRSSYHVVAQWRFVEGEVANPTDLKAGGGGAAAEPATEVVERPDLAK